MCTCNLCKFHRRIKRTIKSGSHQQKNRLILELNDLYLHTSHDLDYEKCIADGSWPNSTRILAHRIKNAVTNDADAKENANDLLTKLILEAISKYEQLEMLRILEK